ncbi:MAG: DUF4115 domain-containing protein [Magnetococcales bacterium]|nr:DUF4115 domain-containing protein [Magnetococcales bacterium]
MAEKPDSSSASEMGDKTLERPGINGSDGSFERKPVGAQEVGDLLRQAREAKGFTLDEMSKRTRLRDVHLLSLEAGQVEKLPGVAFVAGFLRLYAKNLELSDHPIVEQFLNTFENRRQNLTTEHFPPPTKSRQRPNSGSIVMGLVGLVALSFGYSHYYGSPKEEMEQHVPVSPPMKVGEFINNSASPTSEPVVLQTSEPVFSEEPDSFDTTEEVEEIAALEAEPDLSSASTPAMPAESVPLADEQQSVVDEEPESEQALSALEKNVIELSERQPEMDEESMDSQPPTREAPPTEPQEQPMMAMDTELAEVPGELMAPEATEISQLEPDEPVVEERVEPTKKKKSSGWPWFSFFSFSEETEAKEEPEEVSMAASEPELDPDPRLSLESVDLNPQKIVTPNLPVEDQPPATDSRRPLSKTVASKPPGASASEPFFDSDPAVEIQPFVSQPTKKAARPVEDANLTPAQRIKKRYQEPLSTVEDLQPESTDAVSLISTELVWVLIQDEEGKTLKDMVMQPNHLFRVPPGALFYAEVGNAGAIQFRVGEKKVAIRGDVDGVIRELELSAASLLARAAGR